MAAGVSQSQNKGGRDEPDPNVKTETAEGMETNCLNGIYKGTNGLLLHTILRVDSLDDLYMFKQHSHNESALENSLERRP
jgi:hypothetical protein